jgi:DNA (cytosine-5)-methyltransferase 1
MMMKGQTDLLDEIIVDNFAGGGGASTGIELATGRTVAIAINHDPDAILMHKTNHPYTEHLQASVWDVDPVKVCRGRKVGLAWFSPDCKHFSKAKGAALVDRNIRGLAWIVLRWAGTVRPRVIILENVEEFQTWGPVRRGRPIKSKAGQTYWKFRKQLADLGYQIDSRELVAADYGAPTTRRRFFLVARCDGKSIVWPKPTHSKDGENGVKPWRSAAEIIDWSQPCWSIFASREQLKELGVTAVRPLADNTMRRIIRGVDKFTIRSGKPFIIQCNHSGGDREQGMDEPMPTISSHHGFGMAAPNLIQYHTEQHGEYMRGQGIDTPLGTVDAAGRYGLTTAQLAEWYGNARDGIDIREPMRTVTSHNREALTTAHVVEFKGTDVGQDARVPLRTVTAGGGEFAECRTMMVKADGRGTGHWPEIRELLNRYCGYHLADDEVLLLIIGGTAYCIEDIGLRMLTPRELYNAMGFPPDYVIDRDYMGHEYGRTKQVARCGNAVCPPMAEAVVRANLPEWCRGKIETMEQLNGRIAI